MLPAHRTKHLPSLAHPFLGHTFHLAQSDDGHSTGTALWLGAQVLSLFLANQSRPPARAPRRQRVVELGSGVGLTTLVLSALGYDVVATDTRHVCHSVLRRNIAANLSHLPATAGVIQVRELDWTVGCDRWVWTDPMRITPTDDEDAGEASAAAEQGLLGPPFDLIISSDTLYDASLVHPFFDTVRALAGLGREVDRPKRAVQVVLALERRDPELIEKALACAPVRLARVATNRVRRAVERAGIDRDESDWEGVEIWKGFL